MKINLNGCNEDQINFIKSDIQDCCLIGIPGGGKTSTIIQKILYHQELTKKSFLIITFSRKACQDFINKGNKVSKNIFSTNNVKTMHSLAGTIINKIDNSKSESIEIVICKAKNYVITHSQEIKNIKCCKDLKVIIIDEAQDISEIQYELAKNLAKELNCKLILVGDPNQNIYQFQKGTDKFLLEHSKLKYYLRYNYRSTPEIVNIINSMKPWKNLLPDIIPTRSSIKKKPVIYSHDQKNIMKHMLGLLEEYKNEGVNMHDIAIIGPVKKSKENKFGQYNNIGLQYFVNYFEDNNIPYVKHYMETTSDCEIVNINTDTKSGHINLYTIHGSKGLEFKKVFLLNFHTSTYGRNPTLKDYNNFRYLWYVGLSRACDELIIYCDPNKNIWYELNKCPDNYYLLEGKEIKISEPIFDKETTRSSSITELLKTKEIFTEEIILDLYNYLNLEIIEQKLESFEMPDICEYNSFIEYSSLYGIYVEQIFEYLYCIKNNKPYALAKKTQQFISNRINISSKYRTSVYSFLRILGKSITDLITLESINNIKNELNSANTNTNTNTNTKELYEEIIAKINEKNIDDSNYSFSLYITNDLIYDNPEEINQIILNLNNNNNFKKNLFLLILYFYQMEHEAKYLWGQKDAIYNKINLDPNFDCLINNIEKYINLENNLDNNLDFQISITSKYLEKFNGIIDCYDKKNKTIYEFKFVKNISLVHCLQIFFYNLIKNPNIKKLENMEIINFYNGTKYQIKLNNSINSFEILLKLAQIINSKINNLIIIYDLETTGLINNNNNQEIYPEIIDRCFYEPILDTIIDNGLVIPSKPISELIINLTNITNEMLESGCPYKVFFNKFTNLNNYLNNPIYIAHNGINFDHKIMCYYNLLDYSKVRFLDSRQIIINFERLSGKLTEMYEKTFKKKPLIAHRAEADVMLVNDLFVYFDIFNKMALI